MSRPSVPHDRLPAACAGRATPHPLLRAAALACGLLALAMSVATGWGTVPLPALPLLVAAVGLLTGWLALEVPLGLVGMVVCAVALASAYGTARRRSDEVRLLGELASEPASGQQDGLAQLVTATARLLAGADVELVVLGQPGASVAGDGRGAFHGSSAAALLRPPWLLSALAADGVRVGRDDEGQPCATIVLRRRGAPLAVLRARRPIGAAAFGRNDRRVLDAVVAEATRRLDPSARRHDLARPSRAYDVRASVDRLDGLADRGADLDELAEELHELERAVASLLGSVPAHPAPAVPARGSAVPAPGSAGDWTTTGVLR